MSHGDESENAVKDIIGINWGSTNFRAWLLSADGRVVDEIAAPAGVMALDRDGQKKVMDDVVARWPNARTILASGMIGSNMGWLDVPYLECPAGLPDLARGLHRTTIGSAEVMICPGLACRRMADDAPDILRGEDIEIFGALGTMTEEPDQRFIVLPGTHTKWARVEHGRLVDFSTSMSGEIFDRLTNAGLLASIVSDPAEPGVAFEQGVVAAETGLGLGTLLFGARAQVIRGALQRSGAASYIRGLLIGSEFLDARHLHGDIGNAELTLVGIEPLCALYISAAKHFGLTTRYVSGREAGVRGFLSLQRARFGA